MTVYLLCAIAIAINVPFGYLRAGYRRFSWPWLLAVHLPVPLIIIARWLTHQGWGIVPLLIVCAVAGQLAGGMVRDGQRRRAPAEES